MKLGVSYFGNRILPHVATDMKAAKAMGFTYIVHVLSENDLLYSKDTIAEIVKITQGEGLEVLIDPWGVGKVFGGEPFSEFAMNNHDSIQMISDGNPVGAACPNAPKFREYMHGKWLEAALATGAECFFWDEPHFYLPAWLGGRPGTWGCRCVHCQTKFESAHGKPLPMEETEEVRQFKEDSIVDFLAELVAAAHKAGRRNSLCVLPLRDEMHATANWHRLAGIPHLDIFGTDPYWYAFKKEMEPFVGGTCEAVVDVTKAHNLEASMWLQGFRTPAGQEDELVAAVQLMVQKGVRDIAVWGWRACQDMSYLAPDNPALAWEKIQEAFRWAAAQKA
jgi:hypothetical protein